MAASRDEAAQTPDRQRRRHGHGEAVAGLHPDAQQRLRQLDPEVTADQAEDDRLAILEPGPAAEQPLPVGQHERQLGPDHRPAERPQPDSQPLAPAQAQSGLRPPAQDHGDRHRGEHDQGVRPGEASDPRLSPLVNQVQRARPSPASQHPRIAQRGQDDVPLAVQRRCTHRTGSRARSAGRGGCSISSAGGRRSYTRPETT